MEDRPVSEAAQRVLDVLEAGGPELPIVVVARMTGIPPTRLAPLLDELHDAGLVAQGEARFTVRLVAARGPTGRFQRPAPSAAEAEAARRGPHPHP